MTTRHLASLRSLVVVLVASAFAWACQAPEGRGNAELEVRFSSTPSTDSTPGVHLLVLVSDLGWRPVNGAEVTATLSGPGGDPTEVTRRLPGVGAGRYELRGLVLDPAGLWAGTIRVDMTGGRWTEVDAEVLVGTAAGGD